MCRRESRGAEREAKAAKALEGKVDIPASLPAPTHRRCLLVGGMSCSPAPPELPPRSQQIQWLNPTPQSPSRRLCSSVLAEALMAPPLRRVTLLSLRYWRWYVAACHLGLGLGLGIGIGIGMALTPLCDTDRRTSVPGSPPRAAAAAGHRCPASAAALKPAGGARMVASTAPARPSGRLCIIDVRLAASWYDRWLG